MKVDTMDKQITLSAYELQNLLREAATAGAKILYEEMVVYNKREAAKLLRMSHVTLQNHIDSGRIKVSDGRITGAEINRFLKVS